MRDDKQVLKDAALDPSTVIHFITFVRQLILCLHQRCDRKLKLPTSASDGDFPTIPRVTFDVKNPERMESHGDSASKGHSTHKKR